MTPRTTPTPKRKPPPARRFDKPVSGRRNRNKRTENISVKVTPELKSQLVDIACARERTLSWIANKMLEKSLQKSRAEKKGKAKVH